MISFKNGIELSDHWDKNAWNIIAVISQSEVMSPSGVSLLDILKNLFVLLDNKKQILLV